MKQHYSYFECIVAIIILPFLLIYWLGIGIWFIQGLMNGLKGEMEEQLNEKTNPS